MAWGKAEENLVAKVTAAAAKAAVAEAMNKKKNNAGGGKAKSKGKDGVASSSKGKGTGKEGQWFCPWAGCPWAIEGKPNHSYRLICGGCSIPRTDKPSAQQRLSTQLTCPSISMKQEQAKKKAEESKKKA